MSGKAPKRKGDGYERELAKYFNEKVFDGRDTVQRAPLSGGGAVRSSGGSDLKNTPYIYVKCMDFKHISENVIANPIRFTQGASRNIHIHFR